MNLPNIPSDNLYKFIALSSLILLAFSLYFFEKLEQELNIEIIEVTAEQKLDIIELEKITKLLTDLSHKLAALTEEVELDTLREILSEENYQKLIEELKNSKVITKASKDNITTIIKELPTQSAKRIFEKEYSELEKLQDTQNQNSIKVDTKTDILNVKMKQRDYLKSIFNYTIYPLIGLMLIGFYLWYSKVQKYQDIILKEQSRQLNRPRD